MATSVLSASRPGAGSAVSTAVGSGTFQIAGVGAVRTAPTPISLAASARATSQIAAALSVHLPLPHGTAVLSASRPGIGSVAARAAPIVWDNGASIWDSGGTAWDVLAGGAYHLVGIGTIGVSPDAPSTVRLAASVTATSRATAATTGGVRINLAAQIGAGSSARARYPTSISLAARITAQSKGSAVRVVPPNRALAGQAGSGSRASAYAVVTSVGAGFRQTDVSIIT